MATSSPATNFEVEFGSFAAAIVETPNRPSAVGNNPPNRGQTTLVSPAEVAFNSRLQTVVTTINHDNRPTNTALSYNSKVAELRKYCNYVYPNQDFATAVNHDCCYRFMVYQCFRNCRKRGG